jgi:hypothetical protein
MGSTASARAVLSERWYFRAVLCRQIFHVDTKHEGLSWKDINFIAGGRELRDGDVLYACFGRQGMAG